LQGRLFPAAGWLDKINDRMALHAPHTLDGAAYMAYATYHEQEMVMDLNEDYQAIRWMQENVHGSPVIVEAHVSEYRWGSRFTDLHWTARRHRLELAPAPAASVTPGEWVFEQVDAVHAFYNTRTRKNASSFLQRYAVKYIIVGQLEQAVYQPQGLRKFEEWDGSLWREVYRQGQTAIYEVIQSNDAD
jgi:uncharacterized membrane protein